MEQKLYDLLKVPFEKRAQQWDIEFLTLLRESKISVMNPEPLIGPDHWPYLHARIETTSTEPTIRVLDWLSERGIGLLIDHSDDQEYPDAILTWGMVWQLLKKGTLEFPEENESNLKTTPLQFDWKQINRSGDPNEDYLPKLVRKVLREFFAEQEILTPRILVYTLDGQNFETAFSLESLGNPPTHEHEGILEAIAWFLPPHYQISLASEKGAPPFVLL